MEVYVQRFDGTVATTEDFVQAIADGATRQGEPLGFDLQRFQRWYHQAGTPELRVERHWNSSLGQLTVDLRQSTPPTPGQAEKLPLVLPIAMALVGEQGRVGEEELLVMEGEHASITLQGQPGDNALPIHAAAVLGAGPCASGPITGECLQLLSSDDDPFCRWDAAQRLARQVLLARAETTNRAVEEALIQALNRGSPPTSVVMAWTWRCCLHFPDWEWRRCNRR